ncbi:MAG: hypothetical protein NTW87_10460, partial [Planctomycetota bacterium]|nr:hypothetical protein [Planctomycetota bacterium]
MSQADLKPIVDPRGRQERPLLRLARRPTLQALKRGKVLFYNNTKLDFCNYGEIFTAIKRHFAAAGIAKFCDYKETVRGKRTTDLENYARMLAREKPVAAVVALGDMGTTPATTIVTIALEKLGIPSVLITASPGAELAEAVAFYRAGQLCLVPVDIYQGSTKADVSAQVDKQIEAIFESLTLPPARIGKRAGIKFALD